MIQADEYKKIISLIPIACVDLIINDCNGRYLLVRRKNEPLKDDWWVVGGRVHSGESAHHACIRKAREEVGLQVDKWCLTGFYEDIFEVNSFGMHIPYHTISLVFKSVIPYAHEIILDTNHSEWRWSDSLPERFKLKAVGAIS